MVNWTEWDALNSILSLPEHLKQAPGTILIEDRYEQEVSSGWDE